MQDAIEISEAKFSVDGVEVTQTKTFIAENGEIYIGLYHEGKWMNVHNNNVKNYLQNEKEIRSALG